MEAEKRWHRLELAEFQTVEEGRALLCDTDRLRICPPFASAKEAVEGVFCLRAEEAGRCLSGEVFSQDSRLRILDAFFSGEDVQIRYSYANPWYAEEAPVEGSLAIVSNFGEYLLPFTIESGRNLLVSSQGPIDSLEKLVYLAKTDWAEAVRLFFHPAMDAALLGADKRAYLLYRALSSGAYREKWHKERAFEEFLLSCGLKQKVEYVTERKQIFLENPHAGEEIIVTVIRNGWGFTRLWVAVEGDFIYTPQAVLHDEDFMGNYAYLYLYLDKDHLQKGKNLGSLRIYNSFTDLELPIQVRMASVLENYGKRQRERNKWMVQLLDAYQQFRLGRLEANLWLDTAQNLLDRMEVLAKTSITIRLYRIHLLISKENYREAEWQLGQLEDGFGERKRKQPRLAAYESYLRTLVYPEGGSDGDSLLYVERVHGLYPSDWRVGWLLLCLSSQYAQKKAKRWAFLESLWQQGCISPLIYLEAFLVLLEQPSLLARLGGFEEQVLRYGSKRQAISRELLDAVMALIAREKSYRPLLFALMAQGFYAYGDAGILQDICSYLIRTEQFGAKAFEWYKKGIEWGLNLARLYEAFMYSLDVRQEPTLPAEILPYFAKNNSLDYEKNSYLYAYILKNRDALGEIYGKYQSAIYRFVLRQVVLGHINRDLAYLYNEVLTPEMVDSSNGAALCRIYFTHRITWTMSGIVKVLVWQSGNGLENGYGAGKGWAVVPIYGEDSLVVLEHQDGSRFAHSSRFSVEQMMQPGKLLQRAASFVSGNLSLDIYLCGSGRGWAKVSGGGLERAMRLGSHPAAKDWLKSETRMKIAGYLDSKGLHTLLEEYLERISPGEVDAQERRRFMSLSVKLGRYDMAYRWLQSSGPYALDKDSLHKLTEYRLEMGDMTDTVYEAARLCFLHGRKSPMLAACLGQEFAGDSLSLAKLWHMLDEYGQDKRELSGRLLEQMAHSGRILPEAGAIFRDYMDACTGGEEEKALSLELGQERRILSAFLEAWARQVYRHEEEGAAELLAAVRDLHRRGEILCDMVKLAFLRHFARHNNLCSPPDALLVREFLEFFLRRGIRLGFFRRLSMCPDLLWHLEDRVMAECWSSSEEVQIRYSIYEGDVSGEERVENMTPVCGGLYCKDFILFFGERLAYRIYEGQGRLEGMEQWLGAADLVPSKEGAICSINDMLIGEMTGDDAKKLEGLEAYFRGDFLDKELFALM